MTTKIFQKSNLIPMFLYGKKIKCFKNKTGKNIVIYNIHN